MVIKVYSSVTFELNRVSYIIVF